jgi:hypothetical protein
MIWVAGERRRLLAACALGPEPVYRLAHSQPRRTTQATSGFPPDASHKSQKEAGRLYLLEGREVQQGVAFLWQTSYHRMAPASGRAARLTSQTVLGREISTAPRSFQVGWLMAAGHQQEAGDAAIRPLVPIHPGMVEVDG